MNDEWDMIIGLNSDEPTVSLTQALGFKASASAYQSIPFIIISPEASTHSRIKWMKLGATDVVESHVDELLALVVSRDLVAARVTPDVKNQEADAAASINNRLEAVLAKESEKEKLTLLHVDLHRWASITASFDTEQKNYLKNNIEKEMQAHLEKEAELFIQEDSVQVLAPLGESEAPLRNLTQVFDKLFIDVGEKSIQVAVSVGALALKHATKNHEQTLKQVIQLANAANEKGINKYELFCPSANLEKQATEGDAHALVQHALDNQSFRLMFQPVASLRGDEEEHYDVLLRIIDPEGKEVPAGQFMGPIDKTPLAEKIDKWVILQSVKRLLQHKDKGEHSHLFLHISAASIQDKKFLPWLFLVIKKTGIKPQSLVFQLAEENAARFSDAASNIIAGMEKVGCRTSLCHFGSTMNPMKIAKDFATDYVKLGGEMTTDLAENPDKEKPVRETIEALQELGRKTIVPQIESPNVMTRVWRTGSDYVQGYFLQKPKSDMDYDFSSD
ncbi:EAL domain-containing protein [Parendozoicomonas haliclonae]|nr:EAL domain-containing protein [Parendozoicomonas haliclonae]